MTRALTDQLLLAAGRVPRYVTIGERDPQQQVRVTLEGLAAPLDVTRNHVVAVLRPLTIALALPALAGQEMEGHRVRLRFSPTDLPDTTLGSVGLRHDAVIRVDGVALQLFRVERDAMTCMPWGAAAAYRLYHAWTERRQRPIVRMERRERMAFEVLYVCPRPVVLVSVQYGATDNLFPMDLIGPTEGPYFLMALRSTSASIPLMAASRRMALADVPLEYAAIATRLGDHHKRTLVDWDALPFEVDRSPVHGLRVPRRALRIRDVEVRETLELGSHTLFVTEVVGDERRYDGLQMFTVSGPYYRYLRMRGIRPPRAPTS